MVVHDLTPLCCLRVVRFSKRRQKLKLVQTLCPEVVHRHSEFAWNAEVSGQTRGEQFRRGLRRMIRTSLARGRATCAFTVPSGTPNRQAVSFVVKPSRSRN